LNLSISGNRLYFIELCDSESNRSRGRPSAGPVSSYWTLAWKPSRLAHIDLRSERDLRRGSYCRHPQMLATRTL